MTNAFSPHAGATIEDDPTYKQFHTRTVPLGGRDAIDWSDCGLAKVRGARRLPSVEKRRAVRADSASAEPK